MKYLFLLSIGLCILKAEAQSSVLSVADSLAAVGNYTKAIEQFQSIQDPSAQIDLKIARAYRTIGNGNAALEAYKASLLKDPSQVIAATEYGRLHISQRHFKKGDSIFKSLSALYPDNPEFHYQRGRALRNLGPQIEVNNGDTLKIAAHSAFAKAVQLDSTHQKAMNQLGLYYLKKQQYDIVEQIGMKAMESNPNGVAMTNLMALNYYNKGWTSEAVEWLEKLITLGQSSPFIHKRLGRSYAKQAEYERAIEQYAIVLEEDDKDPSVHLELARLYQRSQDFEKGIRHAEIAILLNSLPLDDEFYTLATVFKLDGQFEKAIANYQLTLKENPKHIEAQYGIPVAADNYYKSKREVLQMYEGFVKKHGQKTDYKTKFYVKLAQQRIDMLTHEVFMTKDKG
jgi:tetratricopeptide (TPR) repeat protein